MYAVEFTTGLEDAWSEVATFVPRFLAFLAILVVGWFIARLVARVVDGLLERVGFDRAVERGGVGQALAVRGMDTSDLLAKVAKYFVLLITLQAAFGVFGPNPISDMVNDIVAYLPNVFAAIIIIVVAAAIAAAVRELVDAALGSLSYGGTLANIASAVILVIGVFAAVNQLQIAPEIVTGLFYGLLAMVVGVVIVAVGGAGVTEMRPYVRRVLSAADSEAQTIADAGRGAAARVESRVERRLDELGGPTT